MWTCKMFRFSPSVMKVLFSVGDKHTRATIEDASDSVVPNETNNFSVKSETGLDIKATPTAILYWCYVKVRPGL